MSIQIPKEIPLKNIELFELALTHRSSTLNSVGESYERLEFFGDSILGFIVAEYFYIEHPNWNQGTMTKAKASVVQEAPLAEIAKKLGLESFLRLGKGEELMGGRQRQSILADVLEAIIGAIYLESGLEKTRWFILEQFQDHLIKISAGEISPGDYKSKLQETAQAFWKKTPVYEVVREFGDIYNKTFYVHVLLDKEVMGQGTGGSKKEGEQAAAKVALEIIQRCTKNQNENQR